MFASKARLRAPAMTLSLSWSAKTSPWNSQKQPLRFETAYFWRALTSEVVSVEVKLALAKAVQALRRWNRVPSILS